MGAGDVTCGLGHTAGATMYRYVCTGEDACFPYALLHPPAST